MRKTRPTKKAFECWLAKQPAARTFNYTDPSACLIASFLKESCGVEAFVGSCGYSDHERGCANVNFPKWMRDASWAAVNATEGCTFDVQQFRKEYRTA